MAPMFEASDEQRRLVRTMSGFGVPQDDIARHLQVDPKTQRRHFREELDRGMIEANVKVAQSLFQMATQGKNVAAAIFWMKARVGWREKQEVQMTTGNVLETVTDAELERMIERMRDEMAVEDEQKAAEAAAAAALTQNPQ